SIQPEDNVLVIDDLLATGGTIEATVRMIKQLGAKIVDAAFIISLPDLGGEERLAAEGIHSFSLVEFPGH
ncbi:phosphoribosyltransferase family protein, partial [Vibrio vulnificus]